MAQTYNGDLNAVLEFIEFTCYNTLFYCKLFSGCLCFMYTVIHIASFQCCVAK